MEPKLIAFITPPEASAQFADSGQVIARAKLHERGFNTSAARGSCLLRRNALVDTTPGLRLAGKLLAQRNLYLVDEVARFVSCQFGER